MPVRRFIIGDGGDWGFSDNGIDLTLLPAPYANAAHLWMDEANGLTVLGLYNAVPMTQVDRSTDGGATVVTLAAALPRAHQHACMETPSGVILVGLDAMAGQPIQLARSTNGGASWSTITVDAAFTNARLTRRTFFRTSSGAILCSPSSNTVAPRVYRSTDEGATWATVYTPGGATARGCYVVNHIREDNVSYLQWSTNVLGENRISRSIDNGLTWAQVHIDANEPRSGIPPTFEFRAWMARTPDGKHKFYDSPGGASLQWWTSTDQGATWVAEVGSAFNQNTCYLCHSHARLWLSHDATVGFRMWRGNTPNAHPGAWELAPPLGLFDFNAAAYVGPGPTDPGAAVAMMFPADVSGLRRRGGFVVR